MRILSRCALLALVLGPCAGCFVSRYELIDPAPIPRPKPVPAVLYPSGPPCDPWSSVIPVPSKP